MKKMQWIYNQEEFVQSASLDNSFTPVRSGGLEKIKIIENRSDIAVLSQKVNEKRQLMKLISGINDEILGGGEIDRVQLPLCKKEIVGL